MLGREERYSHGDGKQTKRCFSLWSKCALSENMKIQLHDFDCAKKIKGFCNPKKLKNEKIKLKSHEYFCGTNICGSEWGRANFCMKAME